MLHKACACMYECVTQGLSSGPSCRGGPAVWAAASAGTVTANKLRANQDSCNRILSLCLVRI